MVEYRATQAIVLIVESIWLWIEAALMDTFESMIWPIHHRSDLIRIRTYRPAIEEWISITVWWAIHSNEKKKSSSTYITLTTINNVNCNCKLTRVAVWVFAASKGREKRRERDEEKRKLPDSFLIKTIESCRSCGRRNENEKIRRLNCLCRNNPTPHIRCITADIRWLFLWRYDVEYCRNSVFLVHLIATVVTSPSTSPLPPPPRPLSSFSFIVCLTQICIYICMMYVCIYHHSSSSIRTHIASVCACAWWLCGMFRFVWNVLKIRRVINVCAVFELNRMFFSCDLSSALFVCSWR